MTNSIKNIALAVNNFLHLSFMSANGTRLKIELNNKRLVVLIRNSTRSNRNHFCCLDLDDGHLGQYSQY